MAVSFNGTSDLINMGNGSALNIANNASMSLMCWVNFATIAPAADETIVGKGYDGTNLAYFMQVDHTVPGLALGTFRPSANHGVAASFASVGIVANTWYHIYLEYNLGTTTWAWYLNGVFKGNSVDVVGPTSTVDRFFVGAQDFNGVSAGFFSGCVADVALFNAPLTGTEITNLGNGSIRPSLGMSQTLLGSWRLETAAGTQNDLSGNGNNGASTGTTTCGSSPPFSTVLMPALLRMT